MKGGSGNILEPQTSSFRAPRRRRLPRALSEHQSDNFSRDGSAVSGFALHWQSMMATGYPLLVLI